MSEFANPTGISWNAEGTSGQVQYGDDSRVFATFYMKSVLNPAKSQQENKPWYDNKVYVRMMHPGERLNQIDRPASREDQMRFPRQWQQFMLNKTQIPEGTPIELLFPNNPAYADVLKGLGIYTIQQAAELSGNAIDSVGMGGQELVNKAQKYLKESGDSKAYNQLKTEMAEKDHEIKILKEIVAKQKMQIDDLYERVGNTLAPRASDLNPKELRSYDPQTERINSLHVTRELAEKKTGVPGLPTEVVEQLSLNPNKVSDIDFGDLKI